MHRFPCLLHLGPKLLRNQPRHWLWERQVLACLVRKLLDGLQRLERIPPHCEGTEGGRTSRRCLGHTGTMMMISHLLDKCTGQCIGCHGTCIFELVSFINDMKLNVGVAHLPPRFVPVELPQRILNLPLHLPHHFCRRVPNLLAKGPRNRLRRQCRVPKRPLRCSAKAIRCMAKGRHTCWPDWC